MLTVSKSDYSKDTSSGSRQFESLLNCYILSCYSETDSADVFYQFETFYADAMKYLTFVSGF